VIARRWSRRVVVTFLALLTVSAYGNALKAGFTFDDEPDIQNNPVVQHGVDLTGIFARPLPPGNLYRPLTVLTFALNERLAPGNTVTYHAVNIFLHATVTLLVVVLAARLFASVRQALIAGVLFGLHPIHTEAVTSLVGRAELLAALLGLASMLCFVAADDRRSQVVQSMLRLLALMFLSLALLSKESALVLVPLTFLFRIACRRESLRTGVVREIRALDWLPYVLCVAVYTVLHLRVVDSAMVSTVAVDNPLAFVPTLIRVRSALGVLWDYFGLLNFPLILSADYSYAQVPVIDTWIDPRCLAGTGLLLVAVYALRRSRRPAVVFAVVFPFVAVSLTCNLLFPIGTIKAERLLYLPSVGWALLLAHAFDRLIAVPRYRPVALGALTMVTAAFVLRTWTRNWDWMDNASLYRSMVRSAPNSAKSHYNMGFIYQQEGDPVAALAHFHRALEIYHWSGGASWALSIGVILDQQGSSAKAIEWYREALEIEPGFGKAHTNLCRAFLIERRFREAATACRRGLRYDPADANLLKGLGEALIGVGDADRGLRVLRRSLALNERDQPLRTRIAQLQGARAERQGLGAAGQ
jgi:Tfp pilus assembly protein PilF